MHYYNNRSCAIGWLIMLCTIIISVSCGGSSPPTPASTTIKLPTPTPGLTDTPLPIPSQTPLANQELVGQDASAGVKPSINPTPESLGFVPVDLSFKPEPIKVTIMRGTSPKDVLREVSYSGGMGGAGDPCAVGSYDRPTIIDDQTLTLEWQDRIGIYTCGWQPNEEIDYRLINSDGLAVIEGQGSARDDGSGYGIFIEIPLNTSPGIYQFIVQGKSGVDQESVEIKLPVGPRVYRVTQTNQFVMYNFHPDERVRLLVYGEDVNYRYTFESIYMRLIAWYELRTNDQGQFRLVLDDSSLIENVINYSYAFVGDLSGEVIIGSGKSVLLEGRVAAYTPTDDELKQTESIWNRIKYTDLLKPDSRAYDLNLPSNKAFTWRFSWCARDQSTLTKNIGPLDVEFLIDGIPLKNEQIGVADGESSNGWQCRRWITLIPDWPLDSKVVLDIHYTISKDIYDGAATYPAGDYHQVINVNVLD